METAPKSQPKTELAPRLRLAIVRTARRMRQEAGTDLGPSQTAALATIEAHGPLTPSEVARREGIRRPSATRVVAHLEQAGLVERTRDPEDGRCSILTASSEGRALLKKMRARKNAYLAHQLADLPAEDVAALERAADVLEKILDEEGSA